MRVECNSIKDFIENLLAGEAVVDVFDKKVFVDITRRPVHGDSSNVVYLVDIHASVIVNTSDQGQYLLVAGESTGKDYDDATNDKSGTDRAYDLKAKLGDFCKVHGLEVRPGMLSE